MAFSQNGLIYIDIPTVSTENDNLKSNLVILLRTHLWVYRFSDWLEFSLILKENNRPLQPSLDIILFDPAIPTAWQIKNSGTDIERKVSKSFVDVIKHTNLQFYRAYRAEIIWKNKQVWLFVN